MSKFAGKTVFLMTLSLFVFSGAQEVTLESAKVPDFPELIMKDGRVLRNGIVTRVEPDALLIRHDGGIARVSLFELSPVIQARYNFDPVTALKVYQKNLDADRDRRKTQLLEAEKHRAAVEKAQAEREALMLARTEWVPVEATVLKVTEAGALISAKRITMVPTKVRSTLGFLNDGPPERVLVPFSPAAVLLKSPSPTLKRGDLWKGYLNPAPDSFVIDPANGLATVAAHSGVAVAP